MEITVEYHCPSCGSKITETLTLKRGQGIRRGCEECGADDIFYIQGNRKKKS